MPPDPSGRRGGGSWSPRCLNSWQSAQHHVWGHREPELRTGKQTKHPEKGCQEEILHPGRRQGLRAWGSGEEEAPPGTDQSEGEGVRQKTQVCGMDAQAGDSRARGPKETRRGGRWRWARDKSHVRVKGATESLRETSRNHEAHRQRPTVRPELLSMTG